jgi:catechol 2,3-dioxygenase-like lactoylglutathione lyase family enzyme
MKSLVLCCLLALASGGWLASAAPPRLSPRAANKAAAHFHHLHLNATDPARAIDFFTSRFDCERARFGGKLEAVWAQKSWLLFDRAKSAPAWEPVSAIWHLGWGAENMRAEYERQIALGTRFFEPLTDISDLAGLPNFFYAYVEGPDRALIELNTAPHHRFGHLHLFSADPVAAASWYVGHFGARPLTNLQHASAREPRFYKGYQVGPSASLMMDNVNVIIFPQQFAERFYARYWAGREGLAPTKGRTVDHVAFSVDDLNEALRRLEAAGVRVADAPRRIPGTRVKSAFIEGPDRVRVEVVEGHARKQ